MKLGPKMGMEPRSLTRMIKSLEEKGWIEKRMDNSDKRMVNIHLTETGEKNEKPFKKFCYKIQQDHSRKN